MVDVWKGSEKRVKGRWMDSGMIEVWWSARRDRRRPVDRKEEMWKSGKGGGRVEGVEGGLETK